MSAEIIDVSDRVVTFRITGQLTYSEFAAAQEHATDLIRRQGKMRFLVLVENFIGTAKAGNWGDLSFQAQNDPFIEKIAIVGDQKWEDLALLFTGKGVRPVAIEYFPPADLEKARTWVAD
jgi:hypothetical protein